MSTCITVSFHVPPCPHFPCMCMSRPSVKPAVCVYSTWLTCFRRAGSQQQPHHFTSTLSDPHHCQEDCKSTSEFPDAVCTARSLSVQVNGLVRMWSNLFHLSQALSDQLRVLTLPAFVSWSTCSRRAGCQQQSSHTTSALSNLEQAEKLRQAVAAFLAKQVFCLANHIYSGEKRNSFFFLSVQVCWHRTWTVALK